MTKRKAQSKKPKANNKRRKALSKAQKANSSPVRSGLPAIIPAPLSEFDLNQKKIDLAKGDDPCQMFNLTPKQVEFCRQYTIDHNATRAAIRAGYEKGEHNAVAMMQGSRLMSNDKVKACVEYFRAPILARLKSTRETIIAKLEAQALANLADFMEVGPDEQGNMAMFVNLAEVPRELMAALESVEVVDLPPIGPEGNERAVVKTKIKLASQTKAIELLAKMSGVLKEEVTVHHRTEDPEQLAKAVAFMLSKQGRKPG